MVTPKSPNASQPNPGLIFETIQGYQKPYVLKAAVELGLFSEIAKGSHTVAEIAKACQANEHGIRIVCDVLTIIGFLTKSSDRYDLTPDTAMFLDSRSPAYLGKALAFLLHPQQLHNFQNLAHTVSTGKLKDGPSMLAPEDSLWVEFARGMAPLMMPSAQAIAALLKGTLEGKTGPKVLDIAAGHGMFGITLAQQYPKARIYAQDWANVLKVAEGNARALGVGDRHHLMPGSAFEVDFGSGYDAVLLTNFLHHFPVAMNEALLKKVFAALHPGGQIVILEFVPNDDRISPPQPAQFSVVMLANTAEGDAYTFKELSSMCANAGFKDMKFMPVTEGFQSLVVARK